MVTTATETELKYDAPDNAVLPRFDELPAVSRTRQEAQENLEAQYFDTDDLRLIRAGITLRRRVGGHDQGWHLKMPAGAHTRREIHVPLGDNDLEVPGELAERVRVYTRTEALRPAAVITTVRQRLLLIGENGDSLAELAVDNVHSQRVNDALAQDSWREVELELTGGDRALLNAADELLRRSGLHHSANSAKFERAVGIDPAVKPGHSRPRLSSLSPAGEVVLAYLSDQAQAMKSLDPAVRASEPDAVHQMRIATRRLRSTLQSFGKIIWRSGTDHLAAELKWLGALLGEARDVEVLIEHLNANLNDTPVEQVIGPVQARVLNHFTPMAADAHAAVRSALNSVRYFSLLDGLDKLVDEPSLTTAASKPAGAVLRRAAGSAYRRTRRRMRRAERTPAGQAKDVALHQARKAAKRSRYCAEAASLAMGKQASQFARQMKQIQSLLGDHQDSVISRRTERELGIAAALAGENAFTYGLLYERDVKAGANAQAKAFRKWAKQARPRHLDWMS
jgi:CHAD domain-containing protein